MTDVGPITFIGKADGTATLSYTVNGATVNKNIVRQSVAQPTQDLPTTYDIMDAGTTTGCANPANNGPSKILWTGSTMLINGSAITLALKGPATCTYTGTNYTQEGRYGRATLIGRCLNQSPGSVDQTLTLRELEIGQNFFTAQYTDLGGPSATCFQVGLLAGVK